MKFAIGFDVGKEGGIVIIDEKDNVVTMSMPKVGKEIDVHRIIKVLSSYKNDTDTVHCGIEDVHSIHGTSAKANFQFGRALGILEAAVIALGFPFTKISPKKWQDEMWMGVVIPTNVVPKFKTDKETKVKTQVGMRDKVDTKGASLIAAMRLYPNLSLRDEDKKLTKKSKSSHDGIVDALLIATFVKRKFL